MLRLTPVLGSGMLIVLAGVLVFSGCAGSANETELATATETPSLRLVGVLHDDQALNRPHDVELQGNLAFVPGKGGSLATIDISDPTDPKVVSAIVGPRTIEDAETVLPVGDVLFLGSRDFHAVDMANPAKPSIVKSISDRKQIDKINGMAQRGSYIFSADKTGFINVFDVRNPRNPALHDTLDAYSRACQSKPHDIAVFGERIIVVDSATDAPAAVQVYRVAETSANTLLPTSEWELEGSIPAGDGAWDIGGANRVAVSGSYAYVGAYRPDRVAIIDISDPRKIHQVANMPVCDIDATGLEIVGNALFVAGGECVEVIDVSDPKEPVSIAQYRGGDLFPTRRFLLDDEVRFDNGHDLVYRDGYLYVTAQNDNRFGILKVEDERVTKLTTYVSHP